MIADGNGAVPVKTDDDKRILIESLPASLSIAEMTIEVQKAGYAVSTHTVYQARKRAGLDFRIVRHDKGPQKVAKATKAPKASKATKEPKTAREALAIVQRAKADSESSARADLRRMAIRIGTIELRTILDEIEREAGL